jgi:hypothetical protein
MVAPAMEAVPANADSTAVSPAAVAAN